MESEDQLQIYVPGTQLNCRLSPPFNLRLDIFFQKQEFQIGVSDPRRICICAGTSVGEMFTYISPTETFRVPKHCRHPRPALAMHPANFPGGESLFDMLIRDAHLEFLVKN
jgi:hypothetical protein